MYVTVEVVGRGRRSCRGRHRLSRELGDDLLSLVAAHIPLHSRPSRCCIGSLSMLLRVEKAIKLLPEVARMPSINETHALTFFSRATTFIKCRAIMMLGFGTEGLLLCSTQYPFGHGDVFGEVAEALLVQQRPKLTGERFDRPRVVLLLLSGCLSRGSRVDRAAVQ
jgi:hypothetical protein